MFHHDLGRPDMPLHGLFTGPVIERDDPEGLGRVRVQIPGIIEQGTNWALPLGFGGGSKKRGSVFVPPVGAEVAVFFRMGDVDQPYYLGGNLGHGEQLTGTEGDPNAQAIETESYVVLIDDRPESRSLTLHDKLSGNSVQMNGVTRSITVQATSTLNLKADGFVYIEGLQVFVNGVAAGFGAL